jgi:4-amino-4-deoxy-L-arabinose transferase-like glycosyltransferase
MQLQEWIHKLEEGEGVRFIKVGTLALALIALTFIYNLREFKSYSTQEAMDLGQLARNISAGKGYTTDFIRPLSMYLVAKQRPDKSPRIIEPHPDLANPPVYPYLLAGLMKMLPFQFKISDPKSLKYQPEVVIAWFNQALFFVAITLVFFLARQLFDASVAWVSAAVLLGSELFWRFSVSGLPTMLLLVIFLAVFWCLAAMEQAAKPAADEAENPAEELPAPTNAAATNPGTAVPDAAHGTGWFVGRAIVAGALVGLGGLTVYSFAWLILPVVAFLALFFPGRRLALSLLALVACGGVMAPWIVRNYQLSGAPLGTAGFAIYQATDPLQKNDPFPGNRLERSLNVDLSQVAFEHFIRKLVVNAGEILRNEVPLLGGSWISAFFLVVLLVSFRSSTLRRLRIFLLLCLAVLVAAEALGRTHLTADSPEINSENLLVLLAPAVFLFGNGMFFILLDQIVFTVAAMRAVVIGAFVIVASAPLIVTLLPPRTFPLVSRDGAITYFPPYFQLWEEWLKEDELIMSDVPWAVAWYAHRQCLWYTLNSPLKPNNDFFTVNDYLKAVKALCLTPESVNHRFFTEMVRNDQDWGRFVFECLLKEEVPTGFPLRKSPAGFVRDGFFFLADRERWKQNPQR